mmetsp:Transcript_23325/g.50579  ORF Transcript_23325/g.50579 Transcript_23325/m.50579 type:complete len:239 (+) Transcript_23325:133-849(+)
MNARPGCRGRPRHHPHCIRVAGMIHPAHLLIKVGVPFIVVDSVGTKDTSWCLCIGRRSIRRSSTARCTTSSTGSVNVAQHHPLRLNRRRCPIVLHFRLSLEDALHAPPHLGRPRKEVVRARIERPGSGKLDNSVHQPGGDGMGSNFGRTSVLADAGEWHLLEDDLTRPDRPSGQNSHPPSCYLHNLHGGGTAHALLVESRGLVCWLRSLLCYATSASTAPSLAPKGPLLLGSLWALLD